MVCISLRAITTHDYALSMVPIPASDVNQILTGLCLHEQVNVLALTDHDTMAGVSTAFKVAREVGIRLIPGVEISAKFSSRYSSSSICMKSFFRVFALSLQ